MIENLPYPTISHVMEKTDFKSEALAKAAIATLKWLDNGAPELWEEGRGLYKFDMCRFSSRYTTESESPSGESQTNCGTVCCIAGAMYGYLSYADNVPQRFFQRDILCNLFNLSGGCYNPTLNALFYPKDISGDILDATPREGADALRRYLFTGEVKWNY